MSSSKLIKFSKYNACLTGGLLGDCIGSYFEGECPVKMNEINMHIKRVERNLFSGKLPYTDDTAMARKVAQSLIAKNGIDKHHLAAEFTTEYFKEPLRGYGGSVAAVFKALREENYQDPTGPASRQFDGSGSYGNGSAMRIGPAALFAEKLNKDDFNQLITDVSQITHSHQDAINGALLLARAIQMALQMDSSKKLDHAAFIQQLREDMSTLEKCDDTVATPDNNQPVTSDQAASHSPQSKKLKQETDTQKKSPGKSLNKIKPATTYCEKLDHMAELLKKESATTKQVADILGNDIAALHSVPAAVYSFLRTNLYPDKQRKSPFERTIIYAISLGGDTDTIACMAGYIAGAYYGMDEIAESWLNKCEALEEVQEYARQICDINYPDTADDKKTGT